MASATAVGGLPSGPVGSGRPCLQLVTGAGSGSARSRAAFRRRRFAAVVLVAVVLLALRVAVGALGGGPLTAPEPAPPSALDPSAQRWHVVQPGDTLWSIARALQPAGEIRALVDQLAHRQRGAALRPGQVVQLP